MHTYKKMEEKLYPIIKYTRAHLSRKQYTYILAQPSWRRSGKANLNTMNDPYAISKSALKYRPSTRIKIMSRPTRVCQKYDPKASDLIRPAAVTVVPSRRILDLALPSKRLLIETRRFGDRNKIMFESVNKLLSMVRASRYQKYRFICNAVSRQAAAKEEKLMAKFHKALKPEDWQKHIKKLEILAQPKIVPNPKPLGKRTYWRPVNRKRLEILAHPISKKPAEIRDPFKVPPSALVYKISAHINKIAYRQNPPDINQPRTPGAVSPAAMRAVGSLPNRPSDFLLPEEPTIAPYRRRHRRTPDKQNT